jgi:hypothetical protein
MLWQYIIIGAIIAFSLVYLGKRIAIAWRGRCSSNCGCGPDKDKNDRAVTAKSLTILRR